MPADAWPGTVQRYGYVPAFRNVTFSTFDFPGESWPVVWPLILKSCGTFPLLITRNWTVPFTTVGANVPVSSDDLLGGRGQQVEPYLAIDPLDPQAQARSLAQLDALNSFWKRHFADRGVFLAAYEQ